MREILFRGMTEEGEWVYGSYCRHEDDYYIYTSESIVVDPEVNYSENHLIKVEVKPETVGQYTGLKDKNGKRIFEGDRFIFCNGSINGVDWINLDSNRKPKKYDVIFKDGSFNLPLWFMSGETDKTHWVEIIGNVHEESE